MRAVAEMVPSTTTESTRSLQQHKNFYDRRWQTSEITPRELRRVMATAEAIPPGCGTILDVGAGDGLISQELHARGHRIVVLDLSHVALSRLQMPERCCGSADQLPFADRLFDLVLSTEMLEHLPADIYPKVLAEMARVATRSILITVPNMENLAEHVGECGACGHRFHVWGHYRAYSPKSLRGLFPGFRLQRLFPFGDAVPRYNRLLLWVRQHVAGAWAWDERTPCYRCSSHRPSQPRWQFARRLCDHLNFQMHTRTRPGWLLAFYERVQSPIERQNKKVERS